MQFDPNNPIVRLCAEGINREAENREEAQGLYRQAWSEATDAYGKFIAAHYLARVQPSVVDKLRWDETALTMALQTDNAEIEGAFPSLYLNIAKGYEDLNDLVNARRHYQLALSFSGQLKDDGYGNMIRSGIAAGIERVNRSMSEGL